jgi:hypothetical protein
MQKKANFLIFLLASSCLVIAVATAMVWVWFNIRPQPAEKNQAIFEGITYVREVRQSPRPMVVHVVTINLRAEGISFLVTPGDPNSDMPLKARKTTQFLEDYDLQLAVNGDGFTPWRANNLLDFYPKSGDRVDSVGLAASRGTIYSQDTDNEPVLYISRNNQARFNSPLGGVYNAISGNIMLVENGKAVVHDQDEPLPRTAIALDKRRRQMIIIVVDGRQPHYSEGATLAELTDMVIAFGGYNGMNLDGGGSSTMVMQTKNGGAKILNSPIDQRLPGHERVVGNHLGVFANQYTGKD